jgi:S-(hydroxymethyl)glutathione dehydrogenase/alcohol dehydrogenase
VLPSRYEVGKPLVIETVELEGPKAGEVLVEIKATGVCHTDEFTRSGADPEGLFPVIFGHEGAGVVVDVGPGVTSVQKGDHVIPLYTPECRGCKLPLSRKTNLCTAIRATQGKGVMPDGTSRFSHRQDEDPPLHGLLDVRRTHGAAGDRAREGPQGRPFDKICYIGCGVTTGHRRGPLDTAKVEPGATWWSSARRHRPQRDAGRQAWSGADMIVGVDINPAREAWAASSGMTHFVNPNDVKGDLVAHLVELTGGGADYSFECVGNVKLMRQALECCHRGWGVSVIIGVAGAGQEISTRPFQLVTGRVWKGSAFGGARGRTDVPKIVDWYMEKQDRDRQLITHKLPLERINEAFDLMHAGSRSAPWWNTHERHGHDPQPSTAVSAACRASTSRSVSVRGPDALLRVPAAQGASRRAGAALYFLAGLTCTEETFVIKAGRAAARRRARPALVTLRHEPAARASPATTRAGTSVRARASTSTRPRPVVGRLSDEDLTSRASCGPRSKGTSPRTPGDAGSSATRWAATAR